MTSVRDDYRRYAAQAKETAESEASASEPLRAYSNEAVGNIAMCCFLVGGILGALSAWWCLR